MMHLGQRILLVGSGGAGKSTLARQLGDISGLPVVHLDAVYWQPGWVVTPKEAWQHTVETLVQPERWIIDGNYSSTFEQRLAAADTVIFLDYPWWLCLARVLRRWWTYRGRTRPDLGSGCAEHFPDGEFLRWICHDFPRRNRPRLLGLLEEHKDGLRILIHRSPRETRRWLANYTATSRG